VAKMTEPRELFLHELGDVLYAENVLVKALPKLAKEATDEQLRAGFEAHLEETKQHVKNVEKAFATLGEKPKAEKCPGIDGIKAEHDRFMKDEQPSAQICDMFLTGAGARAEHYEIAAYSGLVTSAKALGENDVAQLLQENLRQEQATLQKLETISERLSMAR
jgi:ferritin-like metal-binding protein YciE